MQSNKGKATIYHVAERAGVAISTVSRVLNNSNDVSDATRKKVVEAIDALRFRPDRTAKSLAQKRSHALAIALPSFTTPFHNSILKGVRSRIRGKSLDLLLFDLGSANPHERLLDYLRRGAVDGLLLALHIDDEIGQELQSLRSPVVLIGNELPYFDSFYWNEEAGATAAVEHLLKQGHRDIGIITSPKEEDPVFSRRLKAYRKCLAEAGISPRPEWEQWGKTEKHAGISEESGTEAMNSFLAMDNPPSAVFCVSDTLAIGAWYALRKAGLRVPEDMALVGYDDVKMSRFIGLTSIDQEMLRIGHEATDVLIQRLSGERSDAPLNVNTTPTLIIRESSALPRND